LFDHNIAAKIVTKTTNKQHVSVCNHNIFSVINEDRKTASIANFFFSYSPYDFTKYEQADADIKDPNR